MLRAPGRPGRVAAIVLAVAVSLFRTGPAAAGDEPAGGGEGAGLADGPFLPCASAAEVVAASLAGAPPARLPTWPLYETEITVTPEERILKGRMRVSLASPTDGLADVRFVLPASETAGRAPVRVSAAQAAVGDGAALSAAEIFRHPRQVDVRLPRTARRGERIVVHLEIEGALPMRPAGSMMEAMASMTSTVGTMGSVGAVATDGEGATLLGAHPTLAPFRDGAWQPMPSEAWGPPPSAPAACHLLSVLAPPGLMAWSTGEQVGEVPEPGGHVRHVFVAAGARRMGVVLRPAGLARHERRVGPVRIRAAAQSREVAEVMSGWAAGVLRHFVSVYGDYPWTTLDVVQAPVNGALGGLRAPGLVVVNDMLTDAEDDGFGGLTRPGMMGFMRELVIAHQVAHQWFGEVVDVGGAGAPAIEKALSWHAVLDYTRTRHGAAAARRIRARGVDTLYHGWRMMGRPDGVADRPLVDLPGLAGYLGLTEGKAGGTLEALVDPVGRDRLRAGISAFVDGHRFGHGDREALEAAIRDAAAEEAADGVAATFVRWLDEAHGDEDLGPPTRALTRNLVDDLGGSDPQEQALLQALMDEIVRALSGGGP